jgi:hypothetical protein
MLSVAEYRRFARECRRLAAMLTKPADKRALELMATGWDKTADRREAMRHSHNQPKRLAEAGGC